jgi:hypothetical protein
VFAAREFFGGHLLDGREIERVKFAHGSLVDSIGVVETGSRLVDGDECCAAIFVSPDSHSG